MKKILLCIALILGTHAVSAKNKQVIQIKNDFGQDIVLDIDWRADKAVQHKHQQILLEKNKEVSWKSPISTYHLFSIDVAPASALNSLDAQQIKTTSAAAGNIFGLIAAKETIEQGAISTGGIVGLTLGAIALTGATALAAADAINHAKNHAKIDGHRHSFFVIETTGKKSKVAGQKEIRIKGYASRKHYEDEIAKATTNNMIQAVA